jgi:hypothetical protein
MQLDKTAVNCVLCTLTEWLGIGMDLCSISWLFCYHVKATEQLVKEALQPILEQYRPPGIQALKLDKFNIGTVPPKFDG